MKNLRQKNNIVVNMGDSMLTLVKKSVEIKDKRYEEVKEVLKKEAENYNESVDYWYSNPDKFGQGMLWRSFEDLMISYQRFFAERYALVVNGHPLTNGEESMIEKILDDLAFIAKDED